MKLQTIGLTKEFDTAAGPLTVLDRVDIGVDEGELVTLVGASGCGKSTLLSIVAGLVPRTDGDVLLDGRQVTGPGSDRGLVFQSYTLFPWKTVRENVASTWTSAIISGTPSITSSRDNTVRPASIRSATDRPSRAPSIT